MLFVFWTHAPDKFLSCRCPILERRRFGEGTGRGSAAADFGVSDADVDSLNTQEKKQQGIEFMCGDNN